MAARTRAVDAALRRFRAVPGMQRPAVHNADIARVFGEVADLLEIEQANPFRIRAYRNAARIVEGLRLDLAASLAADGALPKLPGIGSDLESKIREIAASGTCTLLEKLKRELPSGIGDLLHVPGLGPKRVQRLYQELEVQTPEQLCRAARNGRLRALPGFGEKTEFNILQAVEAHLKRPGRYQLATAAQFAYAYADYLRRGSGVGRVTLAGSFRRMRETVGDLDILVAAAASAQVMQRFCTYPEVKEILSQGETRASVVLQSGIQIDLRVVAEESYGAALHYLTGSKAHNIALRKLAQERGLKINEYGVFRGAKRIAGQSEESVYAALGLPCIPPELREDRGEVEAARAGRLPRLVELCDLRGDLHAHTRASDGHGSVRDMARAAGARGLSYLAITEHSRRLRVARGLDPRALERQTDEIERLNAEIEGIRVLKGIEVDILADGTLDLPDSALARLDVVVGAVHSDFQLSRERQTARILKALQHPHLDILAHPSGRLLEQREPYEVDMLRIIRMARARGRFLELNANPARLDLIDTHCRMARDEGVLVCINSDAHDALDFEHLRYGIGQARRGWLEKADVLNTRSLAELQRLLRRVSVPTIA